MLETLVQYAKPVLKLAAAVSFSLYAGCAAPQITAQDVQKELEKMDAWAKECIKTDGRKDGYVSIAIQSRDSFYDYGGGYTAAYNPKENKLLLPEPENEESKCKTIGAMPHELWHAFYDKEEPHKGLIYRKGYRGPAPAEMRTYAESRVNGREFRVVKNYLNLEENLIRLHNDVARARTEQDIHIKLADIKFESAEMTYFLYDMHKDNLQKTEQVAIEKSYNDFKTRAHRFLKEWKHSIEYVPVQWEALEERLSDRTPRNLNDMAQLVEVLHQDVRIFTSRVLHLRAWRDDIHDRDIAVTTFILDYVDRAQMREARKMLVVYESMKKLTGDPMYNQAIKETLEFLNKPRQKRASVSPPTQEDIWSRSDPRITQLRAVFGDEDEVMARVVDSLYDLYFGPVQQNSFQLNRNDLAFLQRFTYDGKPLFKKGVERYSIALDMIEQGHKPEEVRKILLNAHTFRWKNKVYEWDPTIIPIKLSREERKKRAA